MNAFMLVAGFAVIAAAPAVKKLPKGYVCYRAPEPLSIDGRMDEAAWKAAPYTDAFVDIEGDLKPKPRFKTRAKMLWDDDYFYIAAELDEPHVWGTLTEHDSVIFQDNDFEVFIDPDGDNHQYYEIEINALNTEWDLRLVKPYRDGGPALNEWEIPGLKTAVHIRGTLNHPSDTDKGWSVEIAIPWRALGEFANRPSPPGEGDQWRVNFSRVEWQHTVESGKYNKVPGTKEDNWVWSPQGVVDMHRPETWGYVQFTQREPGTMRFRRDPDEPIRNALMAVYHAQRAFHAKENRWSSTLGDMEALSIDPKLGPIGLVATSNGWEATVKTTTKPSRTWHVAHDSRLWMTVEHGGTK